MKPVKILTIVFLLALGAGLGLAVSRLLFLPAAQPPAEAAPPAGQESSERKVLYWYDPMYPGTHFDQPGKSPFMDMDLIPRYAEDSEGSGVWIDPVQERNLAVSTEKAVWGRLSFSRDVPANVEFNDYQLAKVQPRAEGFVEKIYSLAIGDVVRPGDPIASITVPGWASDQSEYLLLKSQNNADRRLLNGVRERLRLSGMPESMLKAVDSSGQVQTRLTISAPIGGVITAIDVYPGMNVDKNMTIAVIQGTDPVWVRADVPERDIYLLDSGQRIQVSLPAWPNQIFYPLSSTLLPQAAQNTRTVPLRLVLENPDARLKPGMSANIRLRGREEEALIIPTQALIDLGREKRVIVRTPEGRFVPRGVQVLRSAPERTALASGLEAGEEVVVSGLFLIDSEANLRGALQRMRQDEAWAGGSAGQNQGREGEGQ
jgi:Cu(I)/Ag(I) efflux system membrane fusion protein